jgi:hydrogenase maturation protease
MNPPRILIAGIGNLFMADDAFGCEVARRLSQRPQPPGVRVVDFGIRSLDLTYAMLDEYEAVILVDAAPRGQSPGTLYVIEPQAAEAKNVMLDAHAMDPVKVLQAVAGLGGRTDHVLIVGCEPTPRDPEADWELSLSDPVKAAVDESIPLIESLVTKILETRCQTGGDIYGGIYHEPVS